jgi:hypothetical protein
VALKAFFDQQRANLRFKELLRIICQNILGHAQSDGNCCYQPQQSRKVGTPLFRQNTEGIHTVQSLVGVIHRQPTLKNRIEKYGWGRSRIVVFRVRGLKCCSLDCGPIDVCWQLAESPLRFVVLAAASIHW